MIVLAIDTALSATSLALTAQDGSVSVFQRGMERGHQECLAPATAALLASAGVRAAEIDRIGVTVGPGSFTGLRVGLAFAKGLALGLRRPLIGLTTLEGLAASLPSAAGVAAAIDARRGRVYLQIFRRGRAIGEPALMDISQAEETLAAEANLQILTGSGAGLLHCPIGTALDLTSVCDPAALARLTAAAATPAALPSPLYIREPDALTLAQRVSG